MECCFSIVQLTDPALPLPAPCALLHPLSLFPGDGCALRPRPASFNTLQQAQQVGAALRSRVCCGSLGRQLHPWVESLSASVMQGSAQDIDDA
jgi:hypothetical protein